MTKTIQTIITTLGVLATAFGFVQFVGLSWSDLDGTARAIGLTFITERPVAAFTTLLGAALLMWRYATKNRALYVRSASMTLVFDRNDLTKTTLEIDQIVQAYADNVTAIFGGATPDPARGSVPREGIDFWIKPLNGSGGSCRQQRLVVERAGKGWEIRHEFGQSLPPCYGIHWFRRFRRTGKIRFEDCHSIDADWHEFSTQRYQVGKIMMAVAVPVTAPAIEVSGLLLLNHAAIELPVNLQHHAREGYHVYSLEHDAPRDSVARYRVLWKRKLAA